MKNSQNDNYKVENCLLFLKCQALQEKFIIFVLTNRNTAKSISLFLFFQNILKIFNKINSFSLIIKNYLLSSKVEKNSKNVQNFLFIFLPATWKQSKVIAKYK